MPSTRSKPRGGARAVGLAVVADVPHGAAVITLDGFPAEAVTYALKRESPSGSVVGVRGSFPAETKGQTTITVRDWEVPFSVPVLYTVTFYDAAEVEVGTATATFTLPWSDCRAYLVDIARPTNSLPLVIESFSPLDFGVPSGVHRVLDRRAPVVVTQVAWTPEGDLVLLTDTEHERDRVRACLGSGYPVLLRTVPEQGIGNMYLSLTTGFAEERILTPGDAAQRRFTLATVQVERPDAGIFVPDPPNTYAGVSASYATYADLLATGLTYDDVAYSFPVEGGAVTPGVPWLPDDV